MKGGTKPAQARNKKGCYRASVSGGEHVTISNIVQSNTNAFFVLFYFRLSIASGDHQSEDGPHDQHTASN